MATIQQIPAPPAVAPSITDPSACRLYREWEAQDFYPALKLLYPQLEDVINTAQNVFDVTKFRGSHVVGTTYGLGETVIGTDNALYTSKQDGNASTPPSAAWYKHDNVQSHIDGSVDSPDGILLKLSTSAIRLKGNDIELISEFGLNSERRMVFNKLYNSDGFKLSLKDNAGNIIGDSIYFDGINWKINTSNILTENSVLVGSETNDAPDKIVRRNIVGDVFARRFRMNYDVRNANIGLFATLVNTDADNSIRTSTIPQVRASLNQPTTLWLSATLANGFTGWCKYRKLGNGMTEVQLYAFNSAGTSSYTNVRVCTLPVGFRPSVIQRKAVSTSRVGFVTDGYLDTDGTLYVQTVGAYYSMTNFIFYTGA
jgi:hypothetical protein